MWGSYSTLFFCFVAGSVVFLSSLIRNKKDLSDMVVSVVVSLLLVMIASLDSDNKSTPLDSLYLSLVYYSFSLGMMLFVFAQEKMLAEINELHVLIYTLVFWYLAWTSPYYLQPLLIGIGGIPSLLVLLNTFRVKKPVRWQQTVMYVWLLVVDVFLLLKFILPEVIEFGRTITSNQPNASTYWQTFIAGCTLIPLTQPFLALMEFFPEKRERGAEYKKRLRSYISLLNRKFQNQEFSVGQAWTLVLVVGGLLLANHYWQLFPDLILISGLIVVAPTMLRIINNLELNRKN